MSKRSVIWSLFQKHSLIWWPTLPFKNFSSLHSMCMKFSDLQCWVQKNTFATEKSLKISPCKRFRPVGFFRSNCYSLRVSFDQIVTSNCTAQSQIHPPSPSKFTPFCFEGFVRTKTFFTLLLGVAYSVTKSESSSSSEVRNYDHPPAPMNHVKYLRAGPAEMPFQNWYTANTNHFRLTDFCQAEIKHTTGLSNKPSTA